jgi:hypothetical protein
MPWVIWQLLVNLVATPLYFSLRMLQYQHQAERDIWIEYIRTLETHVREKFGCEIGGDLSLLHEPIAAGLRIYSAAFTAVRSAERKALRELMAVEEEGLRDGSAETVPVQLNVVAEATDTFVHCTKAAQAEMKLLIEPRISQRRFKSMQWETGETHKRPSGVPSASRAVDPGPKDAQTVKIQAQHLYRGRLGRLTNSSRLKLVFADCNTLLQGLATLRDIFEVAALINGFDNPTPMGMRAMYIVVKVPINMEGESQAVVNGGDENDADDGAQSEDENSGSDIFSANEHSNDNLDDVIALCFCPYCGNRQEQRHLHSCPSHKQARAQAAEAKASPSLRQSSQSIAYTNVTGALGEVRPLSPSEGQGSGLGRAQVTMATEQATTTSGLADEEREAAVREVFFLAQIQLQLEQYEIAQEQAVSQDQLFIGRFLQSARSSIHRTSHTCRR